MDRKTIIFIGMFIGSTIGSGIASLFGIDIFSFTSFFIGSVGSVVGIFIAYKLSS